MKAPIMPALTAIQVAAEARSLGSASGAGAVRVGRFVVMVASSE